MDKKGGLVPPLLEVKLELQVKVGACRLWARVVSCPSLTRNLHAPVIIFNFTPLTYFLPLPFQAPDMVFQPLLDQDHTDGFYKMVDELLDKIF